MPSDFVLIGILISQEIDRSCLTYDQPLDFIGSGLGTSLSVYIYPLSTIIEIVSRPILLHFYITLNASVYMSSYRLF